VVVLIAVEKFYGLGSLTLPQRGGTARHG